MWMHYATLTASVLRCPRRFRSPGENDVGVRSWVYGVRVGVRGTLAQTAHVGLQGRWSTPARRAPREVCELALAHVNTNAIEAAFRRTDLFERRRALMEQWAALAMSEDAGDGGGNGGASPPGLAARRAGSHGEP